MRKLLKDQEVGLDPNFRYRGKTQTRIETLSDACFALAITLLVLSSNVPTSFDSLKASLVDIIPFGVCITLISVIWYQHYLFFLKYGLQDKSVVLINTFLIFLILVFVYPLKFLFKVIFQLYAGLFSGDMASINILFTDVIRLEDTASLMIIYGVGSSSIFFTLAAFYWHANRRRAELALSGYEAASTKTGLYVNLAMGLIPLVSALVAGLDLFGRHTFTVSGFVYFLYPIVMPILGRRRGKVENKLLAEEA